MIIDDLTIYDWTIYDFTIYWVDLTIYFSPPLVGRPGGVIAL